MDSDKPVEATARERESNRQRRLRESLQDIPEPYPTTRADRGDRERRRGHIEALRHRLDVLVRIEDLLGADQKNMHRNRAERNALVWVLQALAVDAGAPPTPKPERRPSVQYAAGILQECDELLATGYVADERPGRLLHRTEAAPLEVPLAIWFYFRGRGDSSNSGSVAGFR